MARGGESQYGGEPRFITNEDVALLRRHGISLIRTDGMALFNQEFRDSEWLLTRPISIAPSADGRRIAVPIWVIKGGSALLDISGHRQLKRIAVLNVPSRQWVYRLDAKSRRLTTLSGLAMSPHGSLLGLIDQNGILQVYRLPGAASSPWSQ